jgi:nucleotide-binding universal stress UspA family protein
MIRRILHPSDFSPASRRAFAKAVALAKENRAQLLVAHVLAPIMPTADGYVSPQIYAQMEAAGRRYAQKHVEALVARAKQAGVKARGLLLEGVAADRIVRAARGQHADLIVMGTHGRTGFARFVLGSVASRVVSHASVPVLTVRGK